MKRIGFLPLFFTFLSIVFVITLAIRIRALRADHDASQVVSPSDTRALPSAAREPVALRGADATIGEATVPGVVQRLGEPGPDGNVNQPVGTAIVPSASAAGRALADSSGGRSLFTRFIAPIASALGISGPAKGSTKTTAPATPRNDTSHEDRSPQDTPKAEHDRTEKADPRDDPTSDSTPPALAGISFNPPQIQDGQDTVLGVYATDDLSGVRTISGTIASPSGAVQGFACQREGQTDHYATRVMVPNDAAEGVWRVSTLNMSDNASNAAAIRAPALPPTAAFRVISSRPDSEGPTLKAIWLGRPSMKAGEKNTLFVQAEDDKSGVSMVSGVFRSPAKAARLGFVCRTGDTWTCEVSAPPCSDCGAWQLEQVQLLDKANNTRTVRATDPMVDALRLEITSDRCDNQAPALQSLVLDRYVVNNTEESVIVATAMLTDDVCGVASVGGQVVGPAVNGPPPRIFVNFKPAGDPQTWYGRIVIPKLASKGSWRMASIHVLDKGNNTRMYNARDAVLSGSVFTVQ